MTIAENERIPDADLMRIGENGPELVSTTRLTEGRRVALFAVPGAFTPTCHSAHLPSFVRNAEAFAERGVDEIVCVAVNDPFVMRAWGETTGAAEAGITMLGDPNAVFTEAVGMRFDAPPVGLIARSKRYAMLIEDGVVTHLNVEESPGTCTVSGGETLLAQIAE